MSKVVEITTEEEYINFVNNNKKAIIFYGANDCPACDDIKPLYTKISNKYFKRIAFGYTDVEKAKLPIRYVPLIVSFHKGEEYKKTVGADKNSLREFIKNAILVKE